MLQLVYSIMHAACHRCTTLGQNSECNTWRVVSPSVTQKKFCLDKSNFVIDKITFVDRSNFCQCFCQTKVILSMTKLLLSDKINFCLTKSTFVWQNQLLSDKSNSVVDKITFVRQKWLLLDKICFCQQKCACYKRRPIYRYILVQWISQKSRAVFTFIVNELKQVTHQIWTEKSSRLYVYCKWAKAGDTSNLDRKVEPSLRLL